MARTAHLLLAAALPVLTLPPTAAGEPTLDPGLAVRLDAELELEPLGEGLWLWRGVGRFSGRPVPANGLVVAGDGEAVVVDTPWTDRLTGLLLGWVEEEVGPVAAVVATHFHPDRLGGIGEVERRGIASWGQRQTARLAAAADLRPPAASFLRQHVLEAAGAELELFFPGPGHSPDNVVVYLPGARLLFGGCLLKSATSTGLGYLGDADVESWAASLAAVGARFPDALRVVPGHGAPGGRELLEHTRELVARHLASERSPAPAARRGGR